MLYLNLSSPASPIFILFCLLMMMSIFDSQVFPFPFYSSMFPILYYFPTYHFYFSLPPLLFFPDEKSCSCDPESEFPCGSYGCLPLEFKCDGKIDCEINAFDERNCTRSMFPIVIRHDHHHDTDSILGMMSPLSPLFHLLFPLFSLPPPKVPSVCSSDYF